jgi:hypothetical protein
VAAGVDLREARAVPVRALNRVMHRLSELNADDIRVRNLDIRLSTWMIRLDRTPSHIEQELQALSAHITQRAASAP